MAVAAQGSSPWPLFDLFLDIPHPAASSSSSKSPPLRVPTQPLTPELEKTIPQVASFAFPEYSTPQQPTEQLIINRWDHYAMRNQPFAAFTFTLQLADGTRWHGHVRRYLPCHLSRYDVSRRGERAVVLLTRCSGADLLYAGLLKSLEAIAALSSARKTPSAQVQEWFLNQLLHHQQQLAAIYASKPPQERGRSLVCSISGLELGPQHTMYAKVDTTRFVLPPSILQRPLTAVTSDSSLLPLLRCVGIVHALRIMAALLSERRIIMVSTSPTRLASCSHAALSMLAQGLLHWQHLYIPVLPPHLAAYLAAPYPYLIGLLQSHINQLDRADGLGEVLVIHLDTNQLETRNMPAHLVRTRLPDLFETVDLARSASGGASSNSELLAQDVSEILKLDKKILYGESTLQQMGETAAKAGKAVKKTFFKLREKGREMLNKSRESGGVEHEEEGERGADEANPDAKPCTPDYIYTESCHNQAAELEARVAFCSFFLCIFGDMRWYLTTPGQGQTPRLDRNRLLQHKRQMGEGEGTPMWPLLQNFCQTQMLEEFAKARVHEVGQRMHVTPDAPLFLQCTQYHRQQQMDFGLLQVRRVARQVATSHQEVIGSAARRMTMSLTSNKNFEGDYGRAVADLVEQCRECSMVLFDVMSVIWLRIRDCKGMQWKHAYQALQILRNLLYHGPLAAISEATDGLSKIRALVYYDHMRNNVADQVRRAATEVYRLLVNRTQLLGVRRVCSERRRMIQSPPPRLLRDARLRVSSPFKNVHAALNPNATTGTVVQIPPASSPAPQSMQRGNGSLLAASPPPATKHHQAAPSAGGINQDLMGLFGDMTVAAPPAAPANPFAGATSSSSSLATPPPSGPTPIMPAQQQQMQQQVQVPQFASPTPHQHPQQMNPYPAAPVQQMQAGTAPQLQQQPPQHYQQQQQHQTQQYPGYTR